MELFEKIKQKFEEVADKFIHACRMQNDKSLLKFLRDNAIEPLHDMTCRAISSEENILRGN